MAITYTKNSNHIQKAVYLKLSGDSALGTLLTGGDGIYHVWPEKRLDFTKYPVVTYDIGNELDRPYQEDDTGGLITNTLLIITIFSTADKLDQAHNIESRVRALISGNRTLDTTDLVCYSCFRQSRSYAYDTEIKAHRIVNTYSFVSAPKPILS